MPKTGGHTEENGTQSKMKAFDAFTTNILLTGTKLRLAARVSVITQSQPNCRSNI